MITSLIFYLICMVVAGFCTFCVLRYQWNQSGYIEMYGIILGIVVTFVPVVNGIWVFFAIGCLFLDWVDEKLKPGIEVFLSKKFFVKED